MCKNVTVGKMSLYRLELFGKKSCGQKSYSQEVNSKNFKYGLSKKMVEIGFHLAKEVASYIAK